MSGTTSAGPELLTGPEAADILTAALAGAGELVSWRATQVEHRPGRRTTVGYQVRVRWSDGRVTDERFGACTGQAPAPATVVTDGEEKVSVWLVPHDPYLPALPAAYHTEALAKLMAEMGLGDGPVRLRLRAYRPRRRAVVEVRGERGTLFLKVVRPSGVRSLHERHRLLRAAGLPVAPSLGYTPEGLLVTAALPGTSLRVLLRRGEGRPPGAAELLALLDRLPAELADGPPRQSWRDRAPGYAAVIGAALPAEAERARQLAEAVTAGATGPLVPTHGDFYEAQLLVTDGRVTGLLDLDTVGPGDRLDDLACMVGHLSVLALTAGYRADLVRDLEARYLAAFSATVDPVALRHRVAGVVLSLATGPYRVQEPDWPAATRQRLDLAERWLAQA